MMNKKSIVEDHKVIASNVTLTDLTDSIKTILKKKNKKKNKEMILIKVITQFVDLEKHKNQIKVFCTCDIQYP